MKIAVIGTGISGLTCAWLLNRLHDIDVFESEAKIGGHTATVEVDVDGEAYNIDTGFIVYNDWTYPNFVKLLTELKVKTQKSNMSFSVMREQPELEYSGSSLKALFCQKTNLLRPSYWRMLFDIAKFNRIAIDDFENERISDSITLKEYLSELNVGERFVKHYLIPMGSAIWSTSNGDMLHFPALFFIDFFKNHGLLSIKHRPQWYVISGGSKSYLEPLTRSFKDKISVNSKISSVTRSGDLVKIVFSDGSQKIYDQVVFACHSDQALELIKDPTEGEKTILGSIAYKNNRVVLHTDASVLPKRKSAWASWNYRLGADTSEPPVLSYYMNQLQSIESKHVFVVTLNATQLIDPKKILSQFNYTHPQFTLETRKAQARWQEVNGTNNTWFCGAYWGSGFHEDGCRSGIRVAKALGAEWEL